MKKRTLVLWALIAALAPVSAIAFAQEAPAPHNAPRTPVHREVTVQGHAAPARDVEGQALILDGEKLRIGDTDLRLFGIVPPQLSASFGPQARTALDTTAAGQNVSCHIRDRDHDGRLLATCHAANGSDLALELLKRGLAVTARGSLADTELMQPYLAAEQAAQTQKIGLWSVMTPPAASMTAQPDAAQAAAQAEAAKKDEEAKKAEAAKVEAAKAEILKADIAKAETAKIEATKAAEKAVEAAKAIPVVLPQTDLNVLPGQQAPGFFARYQILIAGILMLSTALGILGTLVWQRRQERLQEMQALAAALRGELMAARAVCLTRIKTIFSDEDDREAVWPRLRATLYQAYVGKLGWLGAELARQIASIYGQSSDYAAYYNTADDGTTPKRQALGILVKHIEEVLPRLAQIERTGQRLPGRTALPPASPSAKTLSSASVAPAEPASAKPLSITSSVAADTESKAEPEPAPTKPSAPAAEVTATPAPESAATETSAPEVHTSEVRTSEVRAPVSSTTAHKAAEEVTATVAHASAAPAQTSALETPLASAIETPAAEAVAVEASVESEIVHETTAPGALWDSLRRFAREHFSNRQTANGNDDPMADYATLIEQDIANMSFGDADENLSGSDFLRKTNIR